MNRPLTKEEMKIARAILVEGNESQTDDDILRRLEQKGFGILKIGNDDEIDALLARLHTLADNCDLEDRINCADLADAMRDAITMIEKLRNV